MRPTRKYFFDQQFARYLVQFMAIFEGLQVKTGKRSDGEEHMIDVPVAYGSKDRVAAAILNENTQNLPLKIPRMSAYMKSVRLAPDRRKGVNVERAVKYVQRGGLMPDDIKVLHQLVPIPYYIDVELALYASNTNQHWQMLEQILILFDPNLQIQISDSEFDWTKITILELTDILLEENYPVGADRRLIVSTLTFQIPIWITAPTKVRQDFIKDIYIRIGHIADLNTTPQDIIDQLEEAGYEYELVATVDDVLGESNE